MQQTDRKNSLFASAMVVILSRPLNQLKEDGFTAIKSKYLAILIKKKDKLETASGGNFKSRADSGSSYRSISDFKPISSNFSSVKIFDGEAIDGANFQTKKQEIQQHLMQEEDRTEMSQLERWMVFQKVKQVLPENYPKCEYCSRSILSYSEEALDSIKVHKFEVFAKTVLKKKKNWLLDNKDPLRHKNCSIKNSLIHLPPQKEESALELFDLLLMAGGEMRAQACWIYYLWKFIVEILDEGEDFREEGYFQVIKQLSSKKKVYFQILACLCVTVRPSARMYVPLLNYLYYNNLEDTMNQQYYSYCFFNLIKNFGQEGQTNPSMFDLFCISEMRKIPLVVSFPREKLFFMEAYSTVEQLLEEMTKFYELDSSVKYLINVNGVLMEKGSILRQMNKEYLFDEDPEEREDFYWNRFVRFVGYKSYLVLKNMAEYENSVGTYLIMFNHLVQQFRRGLFALPSKSLVTVGGLLIASEIETEECFEFCMARYISRKRYEGGISGENLNKFRSHILRNYYDFQGTKQQARSQIIDIFRTTKVFLTHFFYVNAFINNMDEFEAYLGIKPSSFLVISPNSERVTTEIEFQEIQKWGRSKSELCIKVNNVGDYHFESKHIDLLVSIFEDYIQYLSKQVRGSNNGR